MEHLAIDIGASSGRHIAGWREDGKWKKGVCRFPNVVKKLDGHLARDFEALVTHSRRV